jgi:uncharacterized damage-inducible protein DinB
MTETQRERVPLTDTGERDTALAFLAFARHCVLKKIEGLGEDQLRRVLVPSGTSLLGLIQHLTVGERWWFVHHFTESADDEEWDFGMDVPDTVSADDVVRAYRQAVDESDAMIAQREFEARTTRLVDGEAKTLRWVVAHMTSEVARHAGHADILREQLDGVTGR